MKEGDWWTFYDGDIARVRVEFYKRKAWVHIVFKRWGMDAMRELRARFPEMLSILRTIGFVEVYAFNKPDEKWARFVAMLGFKESHCNNGYTIVTRSTNHA